MKQDWVIEKGVEPVELEAVVCLLVEMTGAGSSMV